MPPIADSSLVTSGLPLSLVCAVIGLGFAIYLIKGILGSSAGNDRMKQIAGAIEEGAKAYLAQQVRSIAMIAVALFFLVGFFRDWTTAIGFLLRRGVFTSRGFHWNTLHCSHG